ncbi:MAG: hypothetical protein LBE60_18240 [Microbacterium sp.]|jgi:hypothetical protein|uniref:hypothetical protein n=1 Tax=Microbacterium sp. TaxID=51671 RepID=UPI00282B5D2D|nr:hypothetical protein [Microbacterium sp.]MDR2323574.1 hypothetical protein [Microbacterium sp.]
MGKAFTRRAFIAGTASLGVLGAFAAQRPLAAHAATMSVSFDDYDLHRYGHLNWQLLAARSVDSSGNVTGFTYGSGNAPGQRPDQHGVTWPLPSYYDATLGSGGYAAVSAWPMQALALYATAKPEWETNGWNIYQDMAEGAACVDDAARAAIALATDYLRNGSVASLAAAKALLTFTCHLTTMEGKVYNFAWLDAPSTYTWDPAVQGQNAHYMYRTEFNRRTAYPPSPGGSRALWMQSRPGACDPADPAIITSGGAPVPAPPFVSHPAYSVYMDDLVATDGSDVAAVYDGPLYSDATSGSTSSLASIKKDWTTSTHNLGAKDARQLWALAMGLQMMQKVKVNSPGGVFSADDGYFAAFLENHLNRVLTNCLQYDMGTLDTRLASFFLAGLSEYFRIRWVGAGFGTYSSRAVTTTGHDGPPSQSAVYAKIDQAIDRVVATQFAGATGDWRNGIFIDDVTGGDWQAWGQVQMYALARAYRLKRDLGQTDAALGGFLDIISYSADNFYGMQAYHFADTAGNNRRTRERIPSITGWAATFHTNDTQIVYHNSSIVAGLLELAEAWGQSGRPTALAKRDSYLEQARAVASWFIGNNSLVDNALSTIWPMWAAKAADDSASPGGSGAFLDAVDVHAVRSSGTCATSTPARKADAGGESTAEGLWAMVLIKDAITKYGLSPVYSFDI